MQSANDAYTANNLATALPIYHEALALAQAQFDLTINTHADRAIAKVVTCFLNIANANITIQHDKLAINQYNKCLFFLNQQMARKDLNDTSQLAILRAFNILRLEWVKLRNNIARDPMMINSLDALESQLRHPYYYH